MNPINDNEVYLARMKKTYMDKAWFMSIIPEDIDTIVDFGCADNSFCHFLAESFPQFKFIGIDNNEEFLQLAEKNGDLCYRSLEELAQAGTCNPQTTLLVLNSVIHEVYSYWSMDEFWKQVGMLNPKCIAIRDMYAKGCGVYKAATQRELEAAVTEAGLGTEWSEFKDIWGELEDGYTATHFLLKYFYKENWAREVKENYLPFHYRDIHKMIRRAGYDVTVERFYGLQYLKDKWTRDFCLDKRAALKAFITQLTTHMKLFLMKAA